MQGVEMKVRTGRMICVAASEGIEIPDINFDGMNLGNGLKSWDKIDADEAKEYARVDTMTDDEKQAWIAVGPALQKDMQFKKN